MPLTPNDNEEFEQGDNIEFIEDQPQFPEDHYTSKDNSIGQQYNNFISMTYYDGD